MRATLHLKEIIANISQPELFHPQYDHIKMGMFFRENLPSSYMLESHKDKFVFNLVDADLKEQKFNNSTFFVHNSNKYAVFNINDEWVIKVQKEVKGIKTAPIQETISKVEVKKVKKEKIEKVEHDGQAGNDSTSVN